MRKGLFWLNDNGGPGYSRICQRTRTGPARNDDRADRQPAVHSDFTSSNSTTLVWPVIGTMTPGDFTVILLPSTRMKYTRSVSKILTGCGVKMSRHASPSAQP